MIYINDNTSSEVGYLQIRAFVADGAEPVEGAHVRISGNDNYYLDTELSLITGRSGLTETVSLPAPDRTLSLSPSASEMPYSTFDVSISKSGFYSKKIFGVAVFSGIKSLLPVSMTPNAGLTSSVTPPSSSNFSVGYENEDL